MPSRSFVRVTRNSTSVVVSLLVLLVGLIGTAFGDAPLREQRRRIPSPPQPAGAVRHDTKFKSVPDSKLEIRAIEYDGSVNGTLTVQVRNAGKASQKFSAAGLYFVPEGDADSAPQRLGAVGPMQITGKETKETKELVIAAGATVEVKLDVFCIDSHRSAPTPQNAFDVGKTRMPKQLTATIEKDADEAVQDRRAAGAAAPRPAAKSAIQSKVWKNRDSKWIKLDGEGKQESAK